MRALPLLLLLACGDKDPTDTATSPGDQTGDTGTDTSPPTPTSESDCTDGLDEDEDGATDCADSDCNCVETDCDDGNDDDLDGLLDCEDEDCVEICVEVCDDGEDNDADGAADCEDDECYGIAGCGGTYEMTLTYADVEVVWAWDAPTGSSSGTYRYPFVTLFESTIKVTAYPSGGWGGTAFSCTGYMGAYVGFNDEQIGGQYVGPAAEKGYLMDFSPTVADGSLSWGKGSTDGSDCPITALPTARLGFFVYQDSVYRYPTSGAPYAQYIPGSLDTYEVNTNSGDTFTARRLEDIRVGQAPTWTGIYD